MASTGDTPKAPAPMNCEDIKRKYDACFKDWYTDKFLRGDKRPGCLDEWEEYKVCMRASLKEKKLLHLLDNLDTAPRQASPPAGKP